MVARRSARASATRVRWSFEAGLIASSGEGEAPVPVRDLLVRIFTNRVILTVGMIEFCTGVLRNGVMHWFPIFAKEVIAKYGTLDVLVNNAGRGGVLIRPPVEYTTEEAMDVSFAINAKGPLFGMKHAIANMGPQRDFELKLVAEPGRVFTGELATIGAFEKPKRPFHAP